MFKQPSQLGGRKPHVQFRAGRMTFSNGVVTPDPQKGILSIVSDSTGAFEVFWTAELGGDYESFVLIKGQATITRVSKVSSGRVFVVDVSSGQRLAFFWFQDKATERDDELLKKMKQLLEAPQSQQASQSKSDGSRLQIDTLQRILADLGDNNVNLQDVLASNVLLSAIKEDPAFYMTRLHEHLPPNTQPDSDVVDEIKNPQVSATAAMMQAALHDQSGSRELASAFQLSGNGVGTLEFLKRIIEEANKGKK